MPRRRPQAAAPAPNRNPPIPLTADSLGAQLLLTVSEQVGEISREVADIARTLTHFAAFYYWFVRTANDPAAYNQLLDIAWKLALVFVCAFAAEWLVVPPDPAAGGAAGSAACRRRRAPRRRRWRSPIRRLPWPTSSRSRRSQQRRLSLARAWQSLVRLPFVLGRLAARTAAGARLRRCRHRCCWAPRSAISRPRGS